MGAAARARGAGVELAYEERGSGPPVLLVHGTALTRLSWRETVAALGEGVRTIAYDRRGYGDSGAPEPYTGTTIEEQAEDAAALLHALDAVPAAVCGHSAGALVALDLLRRHPELARGGVLIEPPLFSLSPVGAEALGRIRERVEAAVRERGPGAGVEAFLEAQDGPEVLAGLDAERLEAIRSSARGAFADFAAANAWEFTRAGLRAVSRRVLVLRGAGSGAIWREVAEALAGLLGAAELRELDAGHVPQLTDPEALAAAIRDVL